MSLSKLTLDMCRYHRISVRKRQKRRCGQGVVQSRLKNIWKEVELSRGPHKIGGSGTCMLLTNYSTDTNLMMIISKYDHGETTI